LFNLFLKCPQAGLGSFALFDNLIFLSSGIIPEIPSVREYNLS
jgi:hypothetical protein